MKIPDSLTRFASQQALVLKKHSPQILFGAGIAGVLTSSVLACRATLKVGDRLDLIKEEIDLIKQDTLQPYLSHRHVAEGDRRRELTIVYAKGAFDITRLYMPALVIGAASIGALTGSHIVLQRRNTSLTAAYALVSKAFDEYRSRVREEVGENRELELYHDGKITVVKRDGIEIKELNRGSCAESMYSRVFDDSNRNWVPNAESNRLFLEANQAHFNTMLRVHKFVFLNDVYDNLGFPKTSAGQMVGWIYGSETGDNYIDFGIYEMSNTDFIINGDRSVYLDFNVDGVIYDLI